MTSPLRRQVTEQILGPPAVAHQARRVSLVVEQVDGGLRVSSPQARGWAAVARNQRELLAAIQCAFTEVQVASYAAWKGEVYDLDALTDVVPGDPDTELRQRPRRRDRTVRSDIRHPSEWARLDDGRWRSPAGRIFREDTPMVQRVIENRRLLGIE